MQLDDWNNILAVYLVYLCVVIEGSNDVSKVVVARREVKNDLDNDVSAASARCSSAEEAAIEARKMY